MMDIILISGAPYTGKQKIQTKSGQYEPKFVDLTGRDGMKRLKEIQESVEKGDMSVLLELIFVPLYGNEKDKELRNNLAQKVIEFELDLCKKDKMSELYLAATLIICNKTLDKSTIEKIWKEIKMINILKFAHDKGKEEGKEEGIKEGMQTAHEMLLEILYTTFGVIPARISDMIKSISHSETLKGLHRQAITCRDLGQFEKTVMQVVNY